MKITGHIHVLPVTGANGTVYPVLLADGRETVLVDCCFPGYWEGLHAALKEVGVDELTGLLFTHQDMDHIGCVNEIKQQWPKVHLYAHKEEAPYLDGRKTPVKLAAMEANMASLPDQQQVFFKAFRAGFENRRMVIDRPVQQGDNLPICGGVQIVHTPGHTPGHICLYIPLAKLLIAGDALNIHEGKLTGPAAQHTLDMPLALESIGRLKQLDVEKVVTYHGGVINCSLESLETDHK